MSPSQKTSDILKTFFSLAKNSDGIFRSAAQSIFLKSRCDVNGQFIASQKVIHEDATVIVEWHVTVDDIGVQIIRKNRMGFTSTYWERPADIKAPTDIPYRKKRGKHDTFISKSEKELLHNTRELWTARTHATDTKSQGRTAIYDSKLDKNTDLWLELNDKKRRARSAKKREARKANKTKGKK